MTALTDLILYYFNLLYYWPNWTECFSFHILSSFARPQVKSLIVKFRLLPRKTSVLIFQQHFFIKRQCFQYRLPNIVVTWAKLLELPFSIRITQFCGNLTKLVGQTSQPLSSFFKRWDVNFECDVSVKYAG